MKYIVLPILKTIYLLFVLLVSYPIIYAILFLYGFWGFDWTQMKEFHKGPYATEDTSYCRTIGKNYWKYDTVWDWYFNRKTIVYYNA